MRLAWWPILLLVLGACASDDAPDARSNPDVDMGTGIDASSDVDGKSDDPDASQPDDDLDALLARLDANPTAAAVAIAAEIGWPAPVGSGYLVITLDTAWKEVAGDFDGFVGQPLEVRNGYAYRVVSAAPGQKYKLKRGTEFAADPMSRSYDYDEFGEVSLIRPSSAHLERHFDVGGDPIKPRTVRVWRPEGAVTHVLYAHDGQNLFDPNAIWGGWRLQESTPAGMMVVGIDNTDQRMNEYTHVPDEIGGGVLGGMGDAYAEFVEEVVRPLIRAEYGEPEKVGVMGSSLGGLISLHIYDRNAMDYDFVASLSGTLGWGSIGLDQETMIARYTGKGVRGAYVYIDSGGNGTTCADADSDGTNDDDEGASDNYCENKQFEAVLVNEGYVYDENFTHWWEPEAPHNEAAWAERVFRPLQIFSAL